MPPHVGCTWLGTCARTCKRVWSTSNFGFSVNWSDQLTYWWTHVHRLLGERELKGLLPFPLPSRIKEREIGRKGIIPLPFAGISLFLRERKFPSTARSPSFPPSLLPTLGENDSSSPLSGGFRRWVRSNPSVHWTELGVNPQFMNLWKQDDFLLSLKMTCFQGKLCQNFL